MSACLCARSTVKFHQCNAPWRLRNTALHEADNSIIYSCQFSICHHSNGRLVEPKLEGKQNEKYLPKLGI
jgi:hypothetical protein